MEIGTRVYHERLLGGVTVDNVNNDTVMVKWDTKPDILYNAGVNPCRVAISSITIIQDDVDIDDCNGYLEEDYFDMLKGIGSFM